MKSTNENKFDIAKFTQENETAKGGFSKALGGTNAGFANAGTNLGNCPVTNSGNCVAGCGGTTQPTHPTLPTTTL
ncbi:hypothetical protein [Chryseobacterium sp. OSA05B]|uniref:hypothetical protein n=1 Tax=Chryseobacterium sp. OSA05B TaxID=2862650 RepID=UPI001CBC4585|nr:hypothetical protein [Chryseobacterium sp. OSA05B]